MNDLAVHSSLSELDTIDFGSFCTGGGGLDRAIELAMPSACPRVYVERESFAAARLVQAIEAGLMASAPVWSNARTFPGRRVRGLLDGLIGGIPCQPHSVAGKRLAELDERDLWAPFRRAWVQTGAWWVLIENVEGMLTSGGAERVYRHLERLGCAVEVGLFTAEEVGLPQIRPRVFILGVHDGRLADARRLLVERWGAAGDVLRTEGPAREQGRRGDASRRTPGDGGEGLVHASGGGLGGEGSPEQQIRGRAPAAGQPVADAGGEELAGEHAGRDLDGEISLGGQSGRRGEGMAGADGDGCSGRPQSDFGPFEPQEQAPRRGDPGRRHPDVADAGQPGLPEPERRGVRGSGRRSQGRATSELHRASVGDAEGGAQRPGLPAEGQRPAELQPRDGRQALESSAGDGRREGFERDLDAEASGRRTFTSSSSRQVGDAESVGRGEGRPEPELRGRRNSAASDGGSGPVVYSGRPERRPEGVGGDDRDGPDPGGQEASGGPGEPGAGSGLAHPSDGEPQECEGDVVVAEQWAPIGGGRQQQPAGTGAGGGDLGGGNAGGDGGDHPSTVDDGLDLLPLFPPRPGDADAWRWISELAPERLPALSRYDLFLFEIRAACLAAYGYPSARPPKAWGGSEPAAWVDPEGPFGLHPAIVQEIAQSTLRRVADGLASRVDELRLLGNGVVDLEGAHAFRTLATRLAARSAGAAELVRRMGLTT